MLKARYAGVIAALVVALVIVHPASAVAEECGAKVQATGGCSVTGSLSDDEVIVRGDIDGPGGLSDTDSTGPTDVGVSDAPGPEGCTRIVDARCSNEIPNESTAPVTLSDIATFHPTPGVDHSQPNGWTVIGLDTNFYATGGQHVVDGILLGQPASVRFTPVQWNWNYGDGTTGARDTPGSPWATRTAEFGPTPTSHVYRQRGTYVVALDVDFAAEYRYAGGSWVPIAGTLTIPANPLTLAVGDAKTVLVEHNCRQDPAGPGC